MPYKVQKKGSQYCVHKENTDGSIGEEVACHDSESSANDQMRALYAAEKSASVEIEIEIEGYGEGEKESPQMAGTIFAEMGFKQKAEYIEKSWEDSSTLGETEVVDVFDGYLICKTDSGYVMVLYTVQDNKVIFDTENISPVELKTQWMAKSARTSLYAVKSVGENRVGGYGIGWGDRTRLDSDGQYFTKNTEHLLDIFTAMGKIPYLVHHAADGVIKSTVIGEVDTMIIDDVGLWYEAKILQQDLYKQYVSKLVDNGKMFSSSGALPAAVKATKDGYISHGPVVEMSCTWTPAEYRMMSEGYSVERLKAHFNDIGIDSTKLFGDEDKAED